MVLVWWQAAVAAVVLVAKLWGVSGSYPDAAGVRQRTVTAQAWPGSARRS